VQTLTNEIIVYQSDATISANINQTFMNIHFIKAMQEQKEKTDSKFRKYTTSINHNTGMKAAATNTFI
jgi:hypothetical protein